MERGLEVVEVGENWLLEGRNGVEEIEGRVREQDRTFSEVRKRVVVASLSRGNPRHRQGMWRSDWGWGDLLSDCDGLFEEGET